MNYSDDQINKYLDGIFDGSITVDSLPEDLYFSIVDHLKDGLYKGFGRDLSQADGKDLALLAEMRDNVYMFGAAKTYQETKAISEKLLDENGDIRSRSSFLEEGRKMFDTWNDDWGKSEYNTAIAAGTMAAKWNDIQDRKHLFPLMRYSTIGDACAICEPLEGFTAKVDDPAWDTIYPPNHFNCQCTTLSEDDETPETPEDERDAILERVKPEMSGVFENNVGKTGSVFPADHPYFKVDKKDLDLAERNFDLPIPPAAEEAGQFIFSPAKDLAEVITRLEATGIKKVSLAGMKLDSAQGVLHAFEREATFGKIKLTELGTVRAPKQKYDAYYLPSTKTIKINLPVINKTKLSETGSALSWDDKIAKMEARLEDLKTNYLGNPKWNQAQTIRNIRITKEGIQAAKLAIEKGEISKGWTISDLATTLPDKIKRTMIHEIGHYRHFVDLELRSMYMDPRFKFSPADAVSEYGASNFKEYFAEWFTQYREFGEAGVPDDILKLFKQIK